jgi:hypothetical protein
MPKNDALVISRGPWDADARPEDAQQAIDAFYARYEQGLADGRVPANETPLTWR